MTPADLDRLGELSRSVKESLLRNEPQYFLTLSLLNSMPELLRLARLGLRAESCEIQALGPQDGTAMTTLAPRPRPS